MKRLVRNPDGSYEGSIAGECQLTAQETRQVRESLSKGPLHLSQIATSIGLPMTDPVKISALQRYLQHLAEGTREAEQVHETSQRGKRDFKGWRLTEHGERMLQIS